MIFNERYQYEGPRLLAAVWAHEALHQDVPDSPKEEMISNALNTLVSAQFILKNPSLATAGTELTRRINTKLMARINSRDAQGNLRLLFAQGNVYPGGTPLENFAAAFGGTLGENTPGNAHLRTFLRKVTGQRVSNANFDDATVNLLY